MNLLGEPFKKGNEIGVLLDPFKADKIEKIFMHIGRNTFNREQIYFMSTVHFKNGNTRGEQEITANSFPDLVKSTEEFIKSL